MRDNHVLGKYTAPAAPVQGERWFVREDPQQFEKIIYAESGEFVARVFAGKMRDQWADEIVRSHNERDVAAYQRIDELRKCLLECLEWFENTSVHQDRNDRDNAEMADFLKQVLSEAIEPFPAESGADA